MRTTHAGKWTVAIIGVALACAVLASLLPDNPYQRWQLLNGTIHQRSSWIYERINDDPTPIDIAFIGPSRVEAGVDAPRLSAALAARGLPSNVVNFSLPETGRDINAMIADELLRTRRPRLLVIGVIEKPSRFGHSAYKYIAPASAVANPGYLGNINYAANLIYLPYRQMRLFAARIMPGAFDLRPQFDPATYAGSSVLTTGDVRMPDGTIKNGVRPASMAELRRGVNKLEAGTTPPLLPASLADVEFGDERHFIRHIAQAARDRGVPIAFLFLPYYTGPDQLQEQHLYEAYGPVWNAGFIADRADLYYDYAHLTSDGAASLTGWLADRIADQMDTQRTEAR